MKSVNHHPSANGLAKASCLILDQASKVSRSSILPDECFLFNMSVWQVATEAATAMPLCYFHRRSKRLKEREPHARVASKELLKRRLQLLAKARDGMGEGWVQVDVI